MSATILPFPRPSHHGVVHVMPMDGGGFEIGHESSSGNSWGSFEGPFDTVELATAAAHALNIRQYGGACEVAIWADVLGGAA
ncbi:hypothetical protein [Rhizorhabdus sp.]|jgi:hypothetical protein|uniref:hypothetical protein n=1 Tax=Rhizorhabdus sp. TaxID=1968843 RepID=UPI0019B709EC|nr:hypothetical protein [Rhizorhabdus sp.]MBD3761472.1 hypothetical protein [Rhizorhabdus sp.]